MGRLFDVPDEPARPSAAPASGLPLAARMRPRTLEEFVGQTHLLGSSSAPRTAIGSGEPHSMILCSDPDASLYSLAAMLEGGEDARFIVRRMVIFASEDVGNADPQALQVAVAAAHAVEHVGLPECTFALAQAAIYLSLAPKSNAAGRALGAARAHIREAGAGAPPAALPSAALPRAERSSPLRSPAARKPGRGIGYDYPHDNPGHVNDQEHLPAGAERLRCHLGADAEPELRERLAEIRRARGRDG